MEKQTFIIPNISCGHCVMSIQNELTELEGIAKVDGDPDNKRITVEWKAPTTLAMIKDKLMDINYPVE